MKTFKSMVGEVNKVMDRGRSGRVQTPEKLGFDELKKTTKYGSRTRPYKIKAEDDVPLGFKGDIKKSGGQLMASPRKANLVSGKGLKKLLAPKRK